MKDLLARCKRRGDLLPILEEGQARYGYLPPEFLKGIADALDLPVNEIYGVASFYSFLSTRPLGRNTIRVCKCLPCYLKGGQDLLESIQAALGIGIGETTSDGSFSLLVTNCIGACDEAPAMMVNGERYGKMDSAGVKEVLARYR
ncbi:MAG: NAD(P)H-dependent oxidoreductase subunit E [Dehalococcoidia bacterium]|nr:NAD(P)H-dependent oxidoreductase subunit E [Dehalococcoidia bacterium]